MLDVFIADTSALRNRGLIFAFTTTPYIATTFAGPSAAQSFLDRGGVEGWRWGYGVFAIVVPCVTTPVALIFLINRKKAVDEGKIEGKSWWQDDERGFWDSVKYYFVEFDGEFWSFSLDPFWLLCAAGTKVMADFTPQSLAWYSFARASRCCSYRFRWQRTRRTSGAPHPSSA